MTARSSGRRHQIWRRLDNRPPGLPLFCAVWGRSRATLRLSLGYMFGSFGLVCPSSVLSAGFIRGSEYGTAWNRRPCVLSRQEVLASLAEVPGSHEHMVTVTAFSWDVSHGIGSVLPPRACPDSFLKGICRSTASDWGFRRPSYFVISHVHKIPPQPIWIFF